MSLHRNTSWHTGSMQHASTFIPNMVIKKYHSWRATNTSPLLYEILVLGFLKNKKSYHILNILSPFWNWFYPCTLFIYFDCIFNVKGGDIQLMVFSFCICSYSCLMAQWPFRGAFWEYNSHMTYKHTHGRHNTQACTWQTWPFDCCEQMLGRWVPKWETWIYYTEDISQTWCTPDHLRKLTVTLSVNSERVKKLNVKRLIVKKWNDLKVQGQFHIEISKISVTLKNLSANVERITQAIKALVKGV
jgi:hypothetical protein